jgi:hypothetical protein
MFCEETGRESVPDALQFTYGTGRGDIKKGRASKNRNPNVAQKYRFIDHDKRIKERIKRTIKANWLIKHLLEQNPEAKFNKVENASPMRAFEAALFMIGDDLGNVEVF